MTVFVIHRSSICWTRAASTHRSTNSTHWLACRPDICSTRATVRLARRRLLIFDGRLTTSQSSTTAFSDIKNKCHNCTSLQYENTKIIWWFHFQFEWKPAERIDRSPRTWTPWLWNRRPYTWRAVTGRVLAPCPTRPDRALWPVHVQTA